MDAEIRTVAPDRLEDLFCFDPLLIVSLIVLSSGAVMVVSIPSSLNIEKYEDVIINLPDVEADISNAYRILGINNIHGLRSIDAIGFNDKVSIVARIIREKMNHDGITNAFFPAFLKNSEAFQPWGAATSFFEGTDGDMPRFLRGGYARMVDDEHIIFAHRKELMRSKISSFKKKIWDFVPIADFPSEIVFMGRPSGLVVPITLLNGDVYAFNTVSFIDIKIANNVKAYVGKTKYGLAFFHGGKLVLRSLANI